MYSNQLIIDILNYLDQHLLEKITIEEISNQFYYNKYYIMKLFKKELNISIITYCNLKRIYNSINDMKTKSNSLTKIALNNGFYSLEYFSETFNQIMHINPKTYQKFTQNYLYLNRKQITTITTNYNSLINTIQRINNYKKNPKPSKPKSLKLSIFQ